MGELAKWAKTGGEWSEEKHPRGDHGRFATRGVDRRGLPSLEVKEATPREFLAAFDAAFAGSPFAAHVSHYTEEELKGMRLLVAEGGKVGVAVHDHGDGRVEATALFNKGGRRGSGLALLAHVIDHAGVNYVECYGPVLNKLYAGLGFKESSRARFNPAYASPEWNRRRFDAPNYYTMKLENAA